MTSLTLNLEKSTQNFKLSLEKVGIFTPPQLELCFDMDVSGSFDDEHRQGVTDALLTRMVPWGLAFDPDGQLDVFTFAGGEASVNDVGPVNAKNFQGFVQRQIIGCPGYGGTTDYAPVLERNLRHFGWLGEGKVKKAGWLGRFMGKKDEVQAPTRRRSLIIMATDGANSDEYETRRVLQESQDRGDEVYFLFLGIGRGSFRFLETIGDQFDNTGFVAIKDLRAFLAQSDDELNQLLLAGELTAWLKK